MVGFCHGGNMLGNHIIRDLLVTLLLSVIVQIPPLPFEFIYICDISPSTKSCTILALRDYLTVVGISSPVYM